MSAIYPLNNVVTRSPKSPVNVYYTKLPCGSRVIEHQRERTVFNFGGNSGIEIKVQPQESNGRSDADV